jgi:WD40 repeat protein
MRGSGRGAARGAGGAALAPQWRTEVGDAVLVLTVSPDDTWVGVGTATGEVLLLDAAHGQVVEPWEGHANGALAAGWSRASGVLATGGQDGRVCFWLPGEGPAVAVGDGAPREEGRRALPWVEHVAWSPDGATCATAAGRHVAIWDHAGRLLRRCPPFRSTVADLQWLPDGERWSAVGYGGAMVWDRRVETEGEALSWKGSFLCHAWAPTGKWLAAGMQESAVHIFEVRTKGDLEMSGYAMKVQRLSWSADGSRMITSGGPYGTVWNFSGKGPAGTRPVSLPGHVQPVSDVQFWGRGLWVATGAEDGQVLVWDLTTSSKVARGAGLVSSPVTRLAWHHRERRLVSGHLSGWVVGWPLVRG